MNPMDRLWSLAAGILALGIGVAAWFGVISPELAATSTARDDLSNVEDLNAIHQLRIAALEEDMSRVGELEAERDALALGIPGDAQYSEFLRQIDAIAGSAGVAVVGVTSGDAVAYTVPAADDAAAPAEEPTDAEGTDGADAEAQGSADASAGAVAGGEGTVPAATPEGETTTGAPAPFTDARITSDNLAAVPFSIALSGDVGGLARFLELLQAGERIVTVSDASITEGIDGGAGTAQVVGYAYVLTTASEATAP